MDINAGIDILPSFLSCYLRSITRHALNFQKLVTNKYSKYYSPKQMKTNTPEGKLRKETQGSQMTDILNRPNMA